MDPDEISDLGGKMFSPMMEKAQFHLDVVWIMGLQWDGGQGPMSPGKGKAKSDGNDDEKKTHGKRRVKFPLPIRNNLVRNQFIPLTCFVCKTKYQGRIKLVLPSAKLMKLSITFWCFYTLGLDQYKCFVLYHVSNRTIVEKAPSITIITHCTNWEGGDWQQWPWNVEQYRIT